MTCTDLARALIDTAPALLIGYCIAAPFLGAAIAAIFYERRLIK